MINDQQGPGPIPNGSRVRKQKKKDARPTLSSQTTLTGWQLVETALATALEAVREPKSKPQPGK